MATNYEWLSEQTKSGDILWHYTTWEGFEGILKTDQLWASDFRFMNDTTELRHAVEFAESRYRDELTSVKGVIAGIRTGAISPSAHVLSTSREFDSLEQWRGYAGSSIGVALGFDIARLTRILNHQGMWAQECLYCESKKSQRIAELVAWAIERERHGKAALDAAADDRERHWAYRTYSSRHRVDLHEFMTLAALVFKDERFHSEREVRFISMPQAPPYNHDDNYVPPLRPVKAYRRRGTVVVPYLPLSLSVVIDGGLIEHPLTAVLFGPNSQAEILTRECDAVAAWIAKIEPKRLSPVGDVKVAVSTVPLRAFA